MDAGGSLPTRAGGGGWRNHLLADGNDKGRQLRLGDYPLHLFSALPKRAAQGKNWRWMSAYAMHGVLLFANGKNEAL